MQESKIIVALDIDDIEAVRDFTVRAGNSVQYLKVGMKLFTKYGPPLILELMEKKYKIFLDLKYHDIPNTVEGACREAVKLGVSMFTVHCGGGREMLKAAVFGTADEAQKLGVKKPLVLGVTVLTSIDDKALKEIGYSEPVEKTVMHFAGTAISEGIDGIVCSPMEVAKLKKSISKKFIAVIPGIRPEASKSDDQKRVATPESAIKDGADFLVIGRPIYASAEPQKVMEAINKSISGLIVK
jgi:orotidine-5'-phosphate decarboxylase